MPSRIRGYLARSLAFRRHLRSGLSHGDAAVLSRRGLELGDFEANGLFDSSHYRSSYPELDVTKPELLLHFATVGWREGRNPSAAFNTVFYLESNPDVLSTGLNPLLHYHCSGSSEGRSPNSIFGVKRDSSRPHLASIYAGIVPRLHLKPIGFSRNQFIFEMLNYAESVAHHECGGTNGDG